MCVFPSKLFIIYLCSMSARACVCAYLSRSLYCPSDKQCQCRLSPPLSMKGKKEAPERTYARVATRACATFLLLSSPVLIGYESLARFRRRLRL